MIKRNGNYVIILITLLASLTIFPFYITVNAEDVSTSTITANPSPIYSTYNSTVTVTVQGTGGLVEGASVGIHVEDGEFTDGTNIHNATSDSLGEVVAQWRSPVTDDDTTYNFTTVIKTVDDNITLTTSVLVYALNFSSSTIDALPEEINETEKTYITVTAAGPGGSVEGATVNLTCVEGGFDFPDDTTDINGEYNNYWTAPSLDDPTNYTIIGTISYTGSTEIEIVEVNVTVNPVEGQILLEIDVAPSYDLTVGDVATIEVTAINSSSGLAEQDVLIEFYCDDGNFTESGLDTFEDVTDTLGKITVHWETDTLIPDIFTGTNYSITLTARKIGLLTNITVFDMKVSNPVGLLNVAITSDLSTITLGDTVNITITVKLDLVAYQDALVEISAQSGVFSQSGNDTFSGYTDSQGKLVATWNTTEMVMVGPDPINYTFTVVVSIFPNHLQVPFTYNITVNPTVTSPSNGGDNPFYTQWWFFVAIGGAVIAIGAVIIFVRKR